MAKVLFVSWDGPQTNYMEGLFLPVFAGITSRSDLEFHVLQFSWATADKISRIAGQAGALGIQYSFHPISRKIHPVIGSLFTVWRGQSLIRKYVQDHKIDVLMPRSTFPAMMTNLAKLSALKHVFDADGFPLEERLAFSGLDPKGLQYKFLKKQEQQMLKKADHVLVRSYRSIAMHQQFVPELNTNWFSVVRNGRDPEQFKPSPQMRLQLRKALNFNDDDRVFVYCGSLGPQYELEEMLAIFSGYRKQQKAKFLILTGDLDYAKAVVDEHPAGDILYRCVPFSEVPAYLSAADIAFALRRPNFSMQGVAPIKLGEYLLMGLPTIASKGIGDTERILMQFADCYLYDHQQADRIAAAVNWLQTHAFSDPAVWRARAMQEFSLAAAADSYIKAFQQAGI